MGWNTPRRPKIRHGKVSYPSERHGSDGDIQIRQTNLGAKLFGKVGGTWYSAPLTATAGDPVTRVGNKLSDHLAITKSALEVYAGGSKVAAFGTSITMGNFSVASNGTVTVETVVLTGRIISGGGLSDNGIGIGKDAGINGLYNACLGFEAGKAFASGAAGNVCIGIQSGVAIIAGSTNTCVGAFAGNTITGGGANTMIGTETDGVAGVNNQIAVGNSAIADGVNVGIWGNSSIATNNITVDWNVTSDRRIKKDIEDSDIGLSFINVLKPRKFRRKHPSEWDDEILEKRYKKGGSQYDDDKDEIIKDEFDDEKVWNGLIAQELKESMDELDVGFSGWNEAPNGRQGIQYSTIVVPLIKAVQELSSKIDTMQIEINNLK